MIRWRYLAPRLVIVLVILIALQFGLGPLAGWVASVAYQRAVGARLEIAESRVGLFPPRVIFRGVAIADPRHERENLAEFDAIELRFNGEQLLHRRYAIETAKLAGVRFSTERCTVGQVPEEVTDEIETTENSALESMTDWLGQLAEDKADQVLDGLETVKISRLLEDEWKLRYETELDRAQRIEATVKTLRDSTRSLDNPLRDIPRITESLQQLEKLGQDLQVARQVMAELPIRLQTDRLRLDEARRRDLQQLTRDLPIQGDLESFDQLTAALLEKYYAAPLRVLREYVSLGKSAGDMTVLKPKADRSRGEDHDLDGRSDEPTLFIRRCEIAGHASVNDAEYALTGLIDGLAISSRPTPIRMRMKLLGQQEIGIDYQRNPDQALSHRILVHAPSLPAGEVNLSAGGQMVIRNAAVPIELWADIQTDGNQLQGRMVARQRGSTLTASMRGNHQLIQVVEASVNDSLASVNQLEMEVTLSGEWRRPRVQVQSNLKPVIAQAFTSARQQLATVAQAKLQEKIESAHQQQTEKLEGMIARQRVELDKVLTIAEQKKQELTNQLASQINRGPLNVGRLQDAMKRF
jgi:uncharacterized protein (TIGR03545 family)